MLSFTTNDIEHMKRDYPYTTAKFFRKMMQQTKTLNIKHGFHKHASADKNRYQASQTRCNRDEGVPKGMFEYSQAKAHPLGHRRAHIVSRKIIHEIVFHHHRCVGETSDDVA